MVSLALLDKVLHIDQEKGQVGGPAVHLVPATMPYMLVAAAPAAAVAAAADHANWCFLLPALPLLPAAGAGAGGGAGAGCGG